MSDFSSMGYSDADGDHPPPIPSKPAKSNEPTVTHNAAGPLTLGFGAIASKAAHSPSNAPPATSYPVGSGVELFKPPPTNSTNSISSFQPPAGYRLTAANNIMSFTPQLPAILPAEENPFAVGMASGSRLGISTSSRKRGGRMGRPERTKNVRDNQNAGDLVHQHKILAFSGTTASMTAGKPFEFVAPHTAPKFGQSPTAVPAASPLLAKPTEPAKPSRLASLLAEQQDQPSRIGSLLDEISQPRTYTSYHHGSNSPAKQANKLSSELVIKQGSGMSHDVIPALPSTAGSVNQHPSLPVPEKSQLPASQVITPPTTMNPPKNSKIPLFHPSMLPNSYQHVSTAQIPANSGSYGYFRMNSTERSATSYSPFAAMRTKQNKEEEFFERYVRSQMKPYSAPYSTIEYSQAGGLSSAYTRETIQPATNISKPEYSRKPAAHASSPLFGQAVQPPSLYAPPSARPSVSEILRDSPTNPNWRPATRTIFPPIPHTPWFLQDAKDQDEGELSSAPDSPPSDLEHAEPAQDTNKSQSVALPEPSLATRAEQMEDITDAIPMTYPKSVDQTEMEGIADAIPMTYPKSVDQTEEMEDIADAIPLTYPKSVDQTEEMEDIADAIPMTYPKSVDQTEEMEDIADAIPMTYPKSVEFDLAELSTNEEDIFDVCGPVDTRTQNDNQSKPFTTDEVPDFKSNQPKNEILDSVETLQVALNNPDLQPVMTQAVLDISGNSSSELLTATSKNETGNFIGETKSSGITDAACYIEEAPEIQGSQEENGPESLKVVSNNEAGHYNQEVESSKVAEVALCIEGTQKEAPTEKEKGPWNYREELGVDSDLEEDETSNSPKVQRHMEIDNLLQLKHSNSATEDLTEIVQELNNCMLPTERDETNPKPLLQVTMDQPKPPSAMSQRTTIRGNVKKARNSGGKLNEMVSSLQSDLEKEKSKVESLSKQLDRQKILLPFIRRDKVKEAVANQLKIAMAEKVAELDHKEKSLDDERKQFKADCDDREEELKSREEEMASKEHDYRCKLQNLQTREAQVAESNRQLQIWKEEKKEVDDAAALRLEKVQEELKRLQREKKQGENDTALRFERVQEELQGLRKEKELARVFSDTSQIPPAEVSNGSTDIPSNDSADLSTISSSGSSKTHSMFISDRENEIEYTWSMFIDARALENPYQIEQNLMFRNTWDFEERVTENPQELARFHWKWIFALFLGLVLSLSATMSNPFQQPLSSRQNVIFQHLPDTCSFSERPVTVPSSISKPNLICFADYSNNHSEASSFPDSGFIVLANDVPAIAERNAGSGRIRGVETSPSTWTIFKNWFWNFVLTGAAHGRVGIEAGRQELYH